MVNPSEFNELRKEFNKIDTNGSGTIEIEELRQTVRKCHAEMSDEDLNRVLAEVDITGTGVINYHEFIAATFPVDKYATPERLHALFARFDMKGDQRITATSLRDAFTKLGHNLTTAEVTEIMNEHDVDHEHVITF
jgi:calcium-dependent protein kinase